MKKYYFYTFIVAIFCAMTLCVSCEASDLDSDIDTNSSTEDSSTEDTDSENTDSENTGTEDSSTEGTDSENTDSEGTGTEDAGSGQATTYTISFETNGGSSITSITIEEGEKASKPEDPTKTGYSFVGWYSDENLTTEWSFDTAITSVTTIYAKWSINSYTVTFNVDGGSDINSQTIVYNEKASKPEDPTKTGYTFVGWCSDEGLTTEWSFDTAITSVTTIYAKWIMTNSNISDMGTGSIW